MRGQAAIRSRDENRIVISEPVAAQTSGLPSFFVVKPLYRLGALLDTKVQRAAASIGYVTTAVSGENLVAAAAPLLPSGTRFSIQDGDTVVGSTDPAPAAARTTVLTTAGRDWTLVVDDGKDPNYSLAWLIGLMTLLITGAVALVLWTRIQAQRRHAADASRHARSADLAQKLAEARTTAAVAEAVHFEVPPLLDALTASVRILDDSQQVLLAVINEELPVLLAERGPVPVNPNSPPGRAVLEHRWILLEDVGREMGDYPEAVTELLVANDFRGAGVDTAHGRDGLRCRACSVWPGRRRMRSTRPRWRCSERSPSCVNRRWSVLDCTIRSTCSCNGSNSPHSATRLASTIWRCRFAMRAPCRH